MMGSHERFCADHARRFLSYILDPVIGCVELRIFRAEFARNGSAIYAAEQYAKTLGGWYDNPDILIADLQRLKGVSGFVTVNPVTRDLLARTYNRISKVEKGGATNDTQIVCRRWIYFDFDPERLTDISSTDDELALAIATRDRFLGDHPEIRAASIWGCSGNGAWILARVPDYPIDEVHNLLIATALSVVSRKYGTNRVKVDPKTKNPSRVMGIAGTRKCKGSDRPERPWRLATIDSPEDHQPTPFDLASWVVAHNDGKGLEEDDDAPLPHSSIYRPSQSWSASDSKTILRATAFVSAIPPAISGQDGHDQTFSVATALVKGFGLSVAESWPILRSYNLSCQPPWTEAELWHKLEDAHEKSDDKDRGYLLTENTNQFKATQEKRAAMPAGGQPFDFSPSSGGSGGDMGSVVADPEPPSEPPGMAIDNPHYLGRRHLESNYYHVDGLMLRFWRDDFYAWDGSRYQPLPKKEVAARVTRSVEAEFREDYQRRIIAYFENKKTAKDDKKTGQLPKLLSVTTGIVADVTQALTDLTLLSICDCPTQPAWLESEGQWPASEIMPTRTSLVHLPSLVNGLPCTIPPTPRFFGRYSVGYGFDPNAASPELWLKFLDQLWPDDPESIAALQEWMGYLLTPDTSQQKIAMMIGPKRSGKGTISRIITAMLGEDNVVNPTLSYLATPFGLASLIGKPAAIITDARIGGRTDSAVVIERLLSISGEDSQTIDRKHRSEVTMKLPTRFMIVSNELPKINDASGALAGRLILFELKNTFYGKEDPLLMSRLIPELPGILKWSIDGWARLRQRGRFTQPDSGNELLTTMEDIASPILAFIRDYCLVGPEEWIPTKDLYGAWKLWCLSRGRENSGTEDSFGRDLHAALPGLKKVVHRIEGKRTKGYLGVRLFNNQELTDAQSQSNEFDF